jgi:energy-converting hydrogenase Eha subunit A
MGDERTDRSWLNTLIDPAGDVIRLLAAPAALALLALVLHLILDAWWIAILVLLAAALVIGVLTVAPRTQRRFSWYGTAIFVAVVVFGATMHALRSLEVPLLQPMALLFTDEARGGGQSGLFVSQTSDRVYLGLVERCHRNPRDLVLRAGR